MTRREWCPHGQRVVRCERCDGDVEIVDACRRALLGEGVEPTAFHLLHEKDQNWWLTVIRTAKKLILERNEPTGDGDERT